MTYKLSHRTRNFDDMLKKVQEDGMPLSTSKSILCEMSTFSIIACRDCFYGHDRSRRSLIDRCW